MHSLEVLGWRTIENLLLFRQQLDLQLVDDGVGDLVLNGKDVCEIPVIPVSPDVTTILALDELGGDAHARAGLADASFQNKFDPEILADLLHLYRLALIGKRRIARSDKQAGDLRQVGDDVFGNPIAKVLLLWITAHIGEG